jgi:ribosomal protein L7/L12
MVDDMQFAKLNERVALLERQVEALMQQLKFAYIDRPATQLYPDVAEMKRRGNIIEAIKLYRGHTNASLAEAKNYVDNMQV